MSVRNEAINRIMQGNALYGALTAPQRKALRRMLADAYAAGERHKAERAASSEPGPRRWKGPTP